ncbi:hypothetical protein [Aestuariirhabdus litorea]|uniref:hypothetical protein n=1 Tax=Aestuariirhabdus litorea TaxID=2528527 RepID=UPI000F620C8E|nr:hypothetical protein [Aestuariirhabdus litorea]RWW97018.1 hypothetical protein DZC74_01345 [Endozoicomonadaceae bacterium GTF-13]
MKNIFLITYIIVLSASLPGCAATNPYNVVDDNYSLLHNWMKEKDEGLISLFFNHSDDNFLNWGLFKARKDVVFKVPSGHRVVIVNVIYAPNGVWRMGGPFNLHETFVRINFNAEKGKSYQPNATIQNGIAEVWVEEVGGKIVSDVVSAKIIPYVEKYK